MENNGKGAALYAPGGDVLLEAKRPGLRSATRLDMASRRNKAGQIIALMLVFPEEGFEFSMDAAGVKGLVKRMQELAPQMEGFAQAKANLGRSTGKP